jgi:YesN/AraC family two-component response regulator
MRADPAQSALHEETNMTKILVIDDEKPTLSMFRLFLEAWGYSVLTAENGTKGLEIFRKEKPAIVITDIKMPGIDGLAVLQRILDIDSEAAVIVITGHGDTDLAQRALENNAVDFIHKPIKKEALEAALKKAGERLDLTTHTDGR